MTTELEKIKNKLELLKAQKKVMIDENEIRLEQISKQILQFEQLIIEKEAV